MESIIIVSLIVLAFLFGRWDGKSRFKKHVVSVVRPGHMPDEEIRKSFMTAVDTKIIFYDLMEVRKGDGLVEYRFEFYVKEVNK